MYKGINEFKKDYQPCAYVIKKHVYEKYINKKERERHLPDYCQ